jgi:tetratricopeptide (TPR) repeat protein
MGDGLSFVGGAGSAMILVGVIGLLSIVAFIFFGLPLLRKIVEKTPSLYEPSDNSSRIVPEYSVAEARVNEGKYLEAVDEYRKVIEKHPDDIYPHLRIAELALNHLNDHHLVEMELLSALEKAEGEVSIALAAGRLADFYQLTLNDPVRALGVMKQVREKIPGTKRADRVDERIAVLERIVQTGVPPPKTPDKIAARPSRYKMSE